MTEPRGHGGGRAELAESLLALRKIRTVGATALLSKPADVETYSELFGHVLGAAVFGDEARAELTRIERTYRRQS